MKRRAFIAGLGSAAAWPLVARGQQQAMPIVAILTGTPPIDFWPGFSQGLKETGFVQDQNVTIEMHSAEGLYDRLPEIAVAATST